MSAIVLKIYGLVYFLHKCKIPILPKLVNFLFLRILFGVYIGVGARIGRGVTIGYGGIGVVIHHRCVIGDNVRIGAGVTLGGTSGIYEVPHIKPNCIIATGAKILGPITIGEGAVIGANAVVTKDIPEKSVAVGVPAKVIKNQINVADYR